jgi:hypothetical protein
VSKKFNSLLTFHQSFSIAVFATRDLVRNSNKALPSRRNGVTMYIMP